MSKPVPLEKQVSNFVRFHLYDNHAFAPMTGTDFAAWHAFIHLVVLWGRTRSDAVTEALRAVLHTAQTRHTDVMAIFKKSIPCLLDWSDEGPLWRAICPDTQMHPCADGPRTCSHIHSRPDKTRPGWFKRKDTTCGEIWCPDPDTAR